VLKNRRSIRSLTALSVILAATAVAAPSRAAVTVVQEIGSAESTGFYPPPPPSAFPDGQLWIEVATPVQAGNRVMVAIALDPEPGIVTCTDGQDNYYTVDADVTSPSVRTVVCSAFIRTEVPVADKIFVVHPTSVVARAMTATEFSGLSNLAFAYEQRAFGTGTGAALSVGPTDPTIRNYELVFGVFGAQGVRAFTAGGAYTGLASKSTTTTPDDANVSVFSEYLVSSTTGPFTADGSMDLSGSWAGAVVTYADICSNLALPGGTDCNADADDGKSVTVRKNLKKPNMDTLQVKSLVFLPPPTLVDDVLAAGLEVAVDVQNGTFAAPFASYAFDASDCKAVGTKGARCKADDGSLLAIGYRNGAYNVTARVKKQSLTIPPSVPYGVDLLLTLPASNLAMPATIRRCEYRNKNATLLCRKTD